MVLLNVYFTSQFTSRSSSVLCIFCKLIKCNHGGGWGLGRGDLEDYRQLAFSYSDRRKTKKGRYILTCDKACLHSPWKMKLGL